jgi:DNA transposition AAA+ family ATPase
MNGNSQIAQLRNVEAFVTMVRQLMDAPLGQERMGCFYGPSGWGKTTAVSAAQVIYDVVAIEVIENTSKIDVLDQIATQFQISSRRDVPARIRAISDFLMKTDRALIIDDAQYLIKRGMIGIARDIYNTCGGIVPVVLVGEEALPQNLTKFENVHNRIAVWEGAHPCDMRDGQRLAEIYAAGVDVEEQLLADIVTNANGAIRRVANMLGVVRELAHARGVTEITRADWGNRPFFDGQPPVARAPAQLKPKVALVASGRKAANS